METILMIGKKYKIVGVRRGIFALRGEIYTLAKYCKLFEVSMQKPCNTLNWT